MRSGNGSQRITAFNPVIFHTSRNVFVIVGRSGFLIIAVTGKNPAALGCFSVTRIGNQILIEVTNVVVEVDEKIRINGFSQKPGFEVQVGTG